MSNFNKLTQFSEKMKAYLSIPYKADYYDYSRLDVPEWVAEHIVHAGNFPEDWASKIADQAVNCSSFTLEINPKRSGYILVFFRDEDFFSY